MIERQITAGTRIVLEPLDGSIRETQPLFAINWFNTRARWLYNLYNRIAAGSVFRIGAKVFFKGRLVRTLMGPSKAARSTLLIVNYPSGERFLDLLSGRFFQITSVLRMLAVRDFSFVLNARADGPALMGQQTQSFDPARAWAVHMFSSSRDMNEEVATLRAVTEKSGIVLHFASRPAVVVNKDDGQGRREPMNYITDRVVILEGASATHLASAVNGAYSEFTGMVQDSYIGLLDRVS